MNAKEEGAKGRSTLRQAGGSSAIKAGQGTSPKAGRVAKRPTRDRELPLKVFVTAEERRQITTKAREAGLSVSAYLRAAGMGKTLRSSFDHAAVAELVKVAGDQGRLGGLLKLWLVDRPG